MEEKDAESQKPSQIPWFKVVLDQGVVTKEIIEYPYDGSGTEEDPYIVEWIDDDPRNPMLWSTPLKWGVTQLVAIATLAVAFVSSAYSGGVAQIELELGSSSEVTTLGISLFVLGFAIGPLLWAPMSELFGRQYLFCGTYAMLTIFNAAATGAQNIWTLIIFRFFAGAFGSSPLTNAGGVIADMFPASQRGLALTIFAAAPFLGPVLGPIIGGFVGETIGWRWIEGIMAIFTGILWIAGSLLIPETYPPVLLRQRANRLMKLSGNTKIYKSRVDAEQGKVTAAHAFKTSMSRPWVLLFLEPIVLLLSIYMAIIYGTLYMLFAAFPIVYQDVRGWSQGIGGLPFLGVMVGMLSAVGYAIWDNKRYIRVEKNSPGGFAPPEARLPVCCIGGIAIPIGLFWFAWTNYPSVHWIVSIIAAAPFGFGMVLVFLGIMNYLIDAYTIFAASVLAANAVLRSCFGAIFPLFTEYMYEGLGIHWASSIPAFLALMCVPFPFLFYKYGPAIRVRCKYAAEAKEFMEKMRAQKDEENQDDETSSQSSETVKSDKDKEQSASASHNHRLSMQREEEREQEAFDYSYDEPHETLSQQASPNSKFQSIKPAGDRTPLSKTRSRASSTRTTASRSNYDDNPWDIDRVNTRESFPGERPISVRAKSSKK